jgi:hypothetical protein
VGPWVPSSKRTGGYRMIEWGEMRDGEGAGNAEAGWIQVLKCAQGESLLFAARGWDVQVRIDHEKRIATSGAAKELNCQRKVLLEWKTNMNSIHNIELPPLFCRYAIFHTRTVTHFLFIFCIFLYYLQVWHLETKLVLFTLEQLHLMPITALEWIPETSLLVTASTDRSSRIWDVSALLSALTAHGAVGNNSHGGGGAGKNGGGKGGGGGGKGRGVVLVETLNTHKRTVSGVLYDKGNGALFTCARDGAVKMYKVRHREYFLLRIVESCSFPLIFLVPRLYPSVLHLPFSSLLLTSHFVLYQHHHQDSIWHEWDSLQVVTLPGAKSSDCGLEPFVDSKHQQGLPSSILMLPREKYERDAFTLVVPTGQKVVLLSFFPSKALLAALTKPPVIMRGIEDDRFTASMDARRRVLTAREREEVRLLDGKTSAHAVREEEADKELMVLDTTGQVMFLDTRLGSIHKVLAPRPDLTGVLTRDPNVRRGMRPEGVSAILDCFSSTFFLFIF